MNLVPPDEHHLLVFWVALLVLLVTARALGGLSRRLGQPAVVGELAAGLVLGPSVLGRLAPGVTAWLFPDDEVQTGLLFTVGWLGVVFLLAATGYETDLALIGRLGRAAAAVATGSLVVPLVLGFGAGWLMPAEFVGRRGTPVVFALFMATALSISSLPVIAKILTEMGFMRRNFGQLTLAAGMVNDVAGWVLLGLIAGMARAGGVEIGRLAVTVGGLVAIVALSFTVGQRIVDEALRRARAAAEGGAVASTVVLVAVALGTLTQWLGLEAVLGAFLAGVLLGRSKLRDEHLLRPIEQVTTSFLAPVFFATAGLRVDLGALATPSVLVWAVAAIGLAAASKFIGALVGARAASLPTREGIALGVGLNARGALEIVIATVGLSIGVLSADSYTLVVLMAMATSLMAPPLLRMVLRDWKGTPEEQQRLEQEEVLKENLVVRTGRMLIPSQGRPNSLLAAQILDLTWPEDAGATVLTVVRDDDDSDLSPLLALLAERDVEHRTIEAEDAVRAIVEEAALGYGIIGVGATDGSDGALLSPVVDGLLSHSTVPVLIVRRARHGSGRRPGVFTRAFVPVAGSDASRAAQEIAGSLSAALGTEVVLGHVVHRHDDATPSSGMVRRSIERARAGVLDRGRSRTSVLERFPPPDGDDVSARLVEDATRLAERLGARVAAVDRRHGSPGREIVAAVADHGADLVVLGATRRSLEGRPFLGHTVEHVLRTCDATVVVVATPPQREEARARG